ncbi:MAG: DUF87 domain-containing protein [Sandaracinus sp.]
MPLTPDAFERLGALYLGRTDAQTPLVIDARALTTHALIVGMTGSGKTGLGVTLIEEAAIDGIPAIVVDPKGDLASLLLAFPDVSASSFAPWVPAGEDAIALAAQHAARLASFGQDAARVGRYAAVERVVYTPGASWGRPLSLLPSLAPPRASETDGDALRERAVTTASAFLGLAGRDADPRTPEHTLLATILLDAWSAGRGLDLPELLRAIQTPPWPRLGVMDVDAVVPPKDRAALAVAINGALASPAMAGLAGGAPLDVGALLYGPDGAPRVSVLSIAHLSDADRQFFVTVLLGELVRWMRAQQGTSSLRALFYMDEIAGYFPPVAEPPTKRPMLTLLKQARAFGLGVVLSTQNPIDLDYKGMSNAGTWLVGRLSTDRDRLRVVEGMRDAASERAASGAGAAPEGGSLDGVLSALPPRNFVMHSVHASHDAVFEVRQTLSYLRGPLSRDELARLASSALRTSPAAAPASEPSSLFTPRASGARPVLPPDVPETFFVRPDLAGAALYRPGAVLAATVAYRAKDVESVRRFVLVAPLGADGPAWADAWALDAAAPFAGTPAPGLSFADLPAIATRAATWKRWESGAVTHVVRDRPLRVWEAPEVSLVGTPGESREAFGARLALLLRERRDAEVDRLVAKWQPKIDRARTKVDRAARQIEDASADRNTYVVASGLEIGATVLGAMFGRRSALRGAASVATKARRAQKRGVDRDRAVSDHQQAVSEAQQLEQQLEAALAELRASWDPSHVTIGERAVAAKKADVTLERFGLVWVPVPA